MAADMGRDRRKHGGTGEALAEVSRHDAELACSFASGAVARAPPCSTGCAWPKRTVSAMSWSWMLMASTPPRRSLRSRMSRRHPDAMVLACPSSIGMCCFCASSAGVSRTRWQGRDKRRDRRLLLGFRVYPLTALLAVMSQARAMRGYDFEPRPPFAFAGRAWRDQPARAAGSVALFHRARRWDIAFPLRPG